MPTMTKVKQKCAPKATLKTQSAIEYAHQAERLGQYTTEQEDEATGSTQAVEAKFITPQDPVIETANGGRLPAVPIEEATKLNRLKDILEDRDPSESAPVESGTREAMDGTIHGMRPVDEEESRQSSKPEAPLRAAIPPPRTNPLFPPLPMYGPPTLLRNLQCLCFRFSSAILSFLFLVVIMLGATFTSIPTAFDRLWKTCTLRNPDAKRPFFKEEQKRREARRAAAKEWEKRKQRESQGNSADIEKEDGLGKAQEEEFIPLEGGPDPLVCDVGYYARRVGLDCEKFLVQTEDGFIIELWHLFNPREYHRASSYKRAPHAPDVFPPDQTENGATDGAVGSQYPPGDKRYPVLMVHGLLQSAGAYCCTEDDSLAFYLAKSGYDVWLGNNRCGFTPRHNLLKYGDPRMWAWNIRQMGVMDLPALISRVLSETGFPKLALVAHSQGTTQTFVALAKEQRPDIGEKISVFCALAPAAYAGPLIGKMYFKFMRVISPGMFRAIFGIHAFIPFMMRMHSLLPAKYYGFMGYLIFSFLFNWSDERWEKDFRDRMFQFAPVYVSAESMRWWLGRECFAAHKCILATREEKNMEEREDEEEDKMGYFRRGGPHPSEQRARSASVSSSSSESENGDEGHGHGHDHNHDESHESHNRTGSVGPSSFPAIPKSTKKDRSRFAWYNSQAPPMAFWIAGSDDLVDGRRLLRRFERGREPHVDLVHAKVIEGYEHLDVLWAMDALEKVGKEVREVIWSTVPEELRDGIRMPTACEGVEVLEVRRGRVNVVEEGSKEGADKEEKEVRRGKARDMEGGEQN